MRNGAALLLMGLLSFAALEAAPRIYAHRGIEVLDDPATAGATAPENTMVAFEEMVKHGISIELDVYLSSDGIPVVIHDGTLERTTNGTGRVTQTPLAALKALDAGSWLAPRFAGQRIPKFEEVLAMIAEKDEAKAVHLAINMKEISPGIEEKVVRLVERFGMLDRVFAFGMDDDSLARYKKANPQFPVCLRATNQQELLAEAQRPGAEWIWISAGNGYDPAKEDVQAAQKAGKKLIIYLQKREPERWRHARKVGIDAICTDYAFQASTKMGGR